MKPMHALPLLVLVISGCGPGVTDGEFSISNGYAFFDPGGDGKMIIYRKGKKSGKIVVDPRVDSYVVDGKKIIVARRPTETVMRGEIADWKLSATCEYWVIDTETHAVQQIAEASPWPKVRCDMGKTYGAMVERERQK